MIKLTPEEQEYWDKKYDEFVREKIREAEEDVRCGRVYTEEEFWEDIDQYEKEYEEKRRIEELKKKELKLYIPKDSIKILKRFIRA